MSSVPLSQTQVTNVMADACDEAQISSRASVDTVVIECQIVVKWVSN